MEVFKYLQIKEQLRVIYYQFLYFFFPTYFYNYKTHIPTQWKPNKDFGGIIDKGEQHLKYPESFEELTQIFKAANESQTPVNICNTGHSQSGVSLSRGWRVCLNRIGHKMTMIDEEHVRVEGICTVGDIVKFLYQHNRHLPIVGTEFSISLGGYLSTGGVGFNSSEYGFLVEHVTQLDLLTMQGEKMSCSRTKNAAVFYSTLVGIGQLGIIQGVTIKTIARNEKNLVLNYLFQIDNTDNVISLLNEVTQLPINYFFSNFHLDHSKNIYFYLCLGFKMDGRGKDLKVEIKKVEQLIEQILDGKKLYKSKKTYQNRFNRLIPMAPMPDTTFKRWSEHGCSLSTFPKVFEHLITTLQKYPKMGYVIPLYIIKYKERFNQGTDHHFFLPQSSEDYLVGFGLYNHFEKGWYDEELMDEIPDDLFELVIQQGGTPFFNSKHKFTEKRLNTIYPNYAKFKKIKQELDPNHLLNNGVFETSEANLAD